MFSGSEHESDCIDLDRHLGHRIAGRWLRISQGQQQPRGGRRIIGGRSDRRYCSASVALYLTVISSAAFDDPLLDEKSIGESVTGAGPPACSCFRLSRRYLRAAFAVSAK